MPLLRYETRSRKKKNPSTGILPPLNQGMITAARYIMVVLGMWTLLSFFFHIDYFPTVDLITATGLLLSMAFVTIPTTAVLSLGFLMPYLFVALFLWDRRSDRDKTRLSREIIVWIGFAMLGLLAANGIVIFYSLMGWPMGWALVAYLGVLALLIVIRYKLIRASHLRKYAAHYPGTGAGRLKRLFAHRRIRTLRINHLGTAIGVGLAQVIPVLMVLLVLSWASDLQEDDIAGLVRAISLVALITAFVSGFIFRVALMRSVRYGWSIVAVVLFLLPSVLGLFMEARGMLPMSVAQVTKMGNFRATRLVLSKEACTVVGPVLGLECARREGPIELCNVHVMSRTGSETYLKLPGRLPATASVARPVLSVFVPTSSILSLEIDQTARFLRLGAIDADLQKHEPSCPAW